MINKDFDKSLNKLAYSKGIRDVFTDIIDAVLYGMIIYDGALIKKKSDCKLQRRGAGFY